MIKEVNNIHPMENVESFEVFQRYLFRADMESFWETAIAKFPERTEQAKKYFRNLCWCEIRKMKYGSPDKIKSSWEPGEKCNGKQWK